MQKHVHSLQTSTNKKMLIGFSSALTKQIQKSKNIQKKSEASKTKTRRKEL